MPAILIIKTSSLGDVIHNLPIVADITAHVPDARIDWVVEETFADIPALHPRVGSVIPVALRRWRGAFTRAATWREVRACAAVLRSRSYDVVLDSQGLLKSAIVGAIAHGPMYGMDRASVREPLAAAFYSRSFAVARARHAVVRNRDLAARALGYAAPAGAPDYGLRIAAGRNAAVVPAARYAVLLHASSRASKRWPHDYWVSLGNALAGKDIVSILPWGSSTEHDAAHAIARAIRGARVAPRLRLRELATVIAHAAAVVGVDTGLVHLAAALGRPTVAIYIDSSPTLTGVLPSDPARAVSLGGPAELPAPDAVNQALTRLGVS